MADVPWTYKVHILGALTLLGFSPFSRLVHIWSAPFPYLIRSYIVYRRRVANLCEPVVGVLPVTGMRPKCGRRSKLQEGSIMLWRGRKPEAILWWNGAVPRPSILNDRQNQIHDSGVIASLFAMVMATGIVAIASDLTGFGFLARPLLWLTNVGFKTVFSGRSKSCSCMLLPAEFFGSPALPTLVAQDISPQ